MLDFLEQEQISKELLEGIRKYRNAYPTPPELQNRIPKPRYHYYGKEVWEASIAALLCGENLLLAGSKATGKNVLAENLGPSLCTAKLGCILSCEHGRRQSHRHGYL